MDGGRTTKRQYSEYSDFFLTQREPEYDQDTELYQREYLQGVRTITRSDSTGPLDCGQPWPDGPDGRKQQRFTNTAVPRFDGTGCWQQHMLVFQAIMKSNGWSPDTAALQLFAHLDGEALQVALLLPDKIRDRWKDLVDTLSAYYKTPGRLAVFRRQFENAHRRPGSDPATFSTTLGMLALRGFSDMKEKARDLMVRNKFVASQQSCDLRRHLDSATPETSIVDIVDSCRIWESHAEPIAVIHRCQDTEYRKPKLLVPPPATDSSVFTVGSVMLTSDESTRRGSHSSVDWELLIRNVLETVATRRDIISGRRRNTELEQLLQDATQVGSVMIRSHSLLAMGSQCQFCLSLDYSIWMLILVCLLGWVWLCGLDLLLYKGRPLRRVCREGGGAPAHGWLGGQWSVFLLWIVWTEGRKLITPHPVDFWLPYN